MTLWQTVSYSPMSWPMKLSLNFLDNGFPRWPTIGCNWSKVRILSTLSWGITDHMFFTPPRVHTMTETVFIKKYEVGSQSVWCFTSIVFHEHRPIDVTGAYNLTLLPLGAFHLTSLWGTHWRWSTWKYPQLLTIGPAHARICGLKWPYNGRELIGPLGKTTVQ